MSWMLVFFAKFSGVRLAQHYDQSLLMYIGPLLYGVIANLCYTMGWVVDIALCSRRPSKELLGLGLIFSLSLTALPGIWAIAGWFFVAHERTWH